MTTPQYRPQRAAEFRQGLAEVLRTPPIFIAAGIEAVMYLGYGVLAMMAKPITGRISDRVGRIPVIIVGLLLCAAALP